MRFILRMAGREIRASWRRLILFFACIAVGVIAASVPVLPRRRRAAFSLTW